MAWVVMLVAVVLLWALLRMVLPPPPSRRRRRLEGVVTKASDRVRHRGPPAPDPFEALRLQSRLSALAGEIRGLEADPTVYAKVHRLVALRAAYDDLLDEACRLAGVPEIPHEQRGEALRWQEEQELAARGWSW